MRYIPDDNSADIPGGDDLESYQRRDGRRDHWARCRPQAGKEERIRIGHVEGRCVGAHQRGLTQATQDTLTHRLAIPHDAACGSCEFFLNTLPEPPPPTFASHARHEFLDLRVPLAGLKFHRHGILVLHSESDVPSAPNEVQRAEPLALQLQFLIDPKE
jgi:hypothetical protein